MKMSRDNAMDLNDFFEMDSEAFRKVSPLLPVIRSNEEDILVLETDDGDECELTMETASAACNYFTNICYALADAEEIIDPSVNRYQLLNDYRNTQFTYQDKIVNEKRYEEFIKLFASK
jgi:hypothetical protein